MLTPQRNNFSILVSTILKKVPTYRFMVRKRDALHKIFSDFFNKVLRKISPKVQFIVFIGLIAINATKATKFHF